LVNEAVGKQLFSFGFFMKIFVLNGPNLNMLGRREPDVYGTLSYEELTSFIEKSAASLGLSVEVYQSNSEGALIDAIHGARDFDGIIVNAGGYTHTSIALRDALLAVDIPIVEVHLSNIFAREDFRKHSFISDIARGIVSGFGKEGYRFALEALVEVIQKDRNEKT
jgi:3-dehydroquinate dehydratase-2